MNMSDDITASVLHVSTEAATSGVRALGKTVDLIANLLKVLKDKHDRSVENAKLKKTDLSDLKPGNNSIKDLKANAWKNGDTISTSENGFTKEDMNRIAQKCKERGIPVAFTGNKKEDNVYANVRSADMSIFKSVCSGVMKDKLAEAPQKLSSFKVKNWEIPFITSELKNHDLAASFAETKNDGTICLFDKSDEKAIKIAHSEFVKKCGEVEKNLSFSKDDEGDITIKDAVTGKEITYDSSISRSELSEIMQHNFGYDENKANIACAKFGTEALANEEQKKFFSNNPQNEFSEIDTNIKVEGENLLVTPYTCWRMTAKTEDVPKIVFSDENGRFAIVDPNKQSTRQMSNEISKLLNTDSLTTAALVEKAIKVHDYYTKQNEKNFNSQYDFSENAKTSLNSLNVTIERNGKDEFMVATSSISNSETAKNGYDFGESKNTISFANKKTAIQEIAEIYKEQGVPAEQAKQMAKETFSKAKAQSAEKILQLEEVRADKAIVTYSSHSEEIDITDRDKGVEEIKEKFEISEDEAAATFDKAAEKHEAAIIDKSDKLDTPKKNDIPLEKPIKPEKSEKIDIPVVGNDDKPEVSRRHK